MESREVQTDSSRGLDLYRLTKYATLLNICDQPAVSYKDFDGIFESDAVEMFRLWLSCHRNEIKIADALHDERFQASVLLQ